MKKKTLGLIVCMMLACMLFVSDAAEKWTCEYCGVENYAKFCTSCGRSRADAVDAEAAACFRGEHDLNEGELYRLATCCQTGIMEYTCKRCKALIYEEIPIDVNNHAGPESIRNKKDATCADDGEGYTGDTYCDACGTLIRNGVKLPKLKSHSFDEGTIVREATCKSLGEKIRRCKLCGHEISVSIPIDKNNHKGTTYIEGRQEPTCNNKGYSGDTCCADCGTVLRKGSTIPATGKHEYDAGTVISSTARVEEIRYSCINCGDSYVETVSVEGSSNASADLYNGNSHTSGAPIRVMACDDSVGDVLDMWVNPGIQTAAENADVYVDWEMIKQSSWEEKFMFSYASGDLPDVFFGASAFSNDEIYTLVDYGMAMPLEDMIDAFCPNISRMFAEHPELREAATWADGHIYALPRVAPLKTSYGSVMYINRQWLDMLGFEIPSTTDELYWVLLCFREGDPNGNGSIYDEIPLMGMAYDHEFGLNALMGAFGITDSVVSDYAFDDYGNVVYVPGTENYRAWLQYIARLYEEGLIDPEVSIWSKTEYINLLNEPYECRYGIAIVPDKTYICSDYRDEFVVLPPLWGPDGAREWASKSTMSNGSFFCAALSCTNQYPVETMVWLDQFYSDDVGLMTMCGLEGVDYVYDGSGSIQLWNVGVNDDHYYDLIDWLQSNAPVHLSDGVCDNIIPEFGTDLYERVEAEMYLQDAYNENRAIPQQLVFYSEEMDFINEFEPPLKMYAKEYCARCITGQRPADDDWDWESVLALYKDFGLDTILDIYTNAINR